jgi:Abnormal spindle-like microcephaly-assoc'd, ASPM-SPD-2-Hydin
VNPGALLFNSQGVGMTSPNQAVTVTNMGSAPLTISNVAASGDFSPQNGCSSVAAAGGTCTIQVAFTPTASGNRTGTLTLTDNSAGGPHTISLAGAVGLVNVSFSPSPLSFPTTNVNQNVAESFTFTNTGVLPLVISNVQVTGPFSPTGVVCTYLVGGATCSGNQIIFSPTATGQITGALTITDNAPGSPHVLALSGTSVATLGLGYSVSSAPNIDVTAGSSGAIEIDVGGAGISGSVTLTCSGVPAGATCSISPSSLQISATSPSRVELSVTTTARSQVPFLSPNAFPWLWTVAVLVGLVLFRIAVATPVLKARWHLVPLFALVLCACGGNGPSSGGGAGSGTPAGNYTIVVTATSGSTTQTLNVPLTVQ